MADIKFTCPHCQQGIQCDQLWCGHEINCPTCQGAIMVPQTATAPAAGGAPAIKPPSSPAARLSAGKTQVARSTTPTGMAQKQFQPVPQKKQSPWLKYAFIGLGVAALGVGGYYGYGLWIAGRDKVKATADAAGKRRVGGEVAGAMDVNDALNGAEPNRPASSLKDGVRKRAGGRRVPGVPAAGDSARALADNGGPDGSSVALAAANALPVVAPAHTMDVSSVTIPASKVNGVISGSPFVADMARIDKMGTAYVLTLRQGGGLTPDRAVRVFLHLQGTGGPTNQTFTVSPDAKDPAVSEVAKLWKTSAGFAPTEKDFFSNYALKLELGNMDKGLIPGKIFLALPDTDKTVVAGQFLTPVIMPDPAALAAAARYSMMATNSAASASRQRYGGRAGRQ
ncbi:MAG: hypothetical protein ACLQM8_03090 [Limisphaerales bacterium]